MITGYERKVEIITEIKGLLWRLDQEKLKQILKQAKKLIFVKENL